jgi:hypothetical protein
MGPVSAERAARQPAAAFAPRSAAAALHSWPTLLPAAPFPTGVDDRVAAPRRDVALRQHQQPLVGQPVPFCVGRRHAAAPRRRCRCRSRRPPRAAAAAAAAAPREEAGGEGRHACMAGGLHGRRRSQRAGARAVGRAPRQAGGGAAPASAAARAPNRCLVAGRRVPRRRPAAAPRQPAHAERRRLRGVGRQRPPIMRCRGGGPEARSGGCCRREALGWTGWQRAASPNKQTRDTTDPPFPSPPTPRPHPGPSRHPPAPGAGPMHARGAAAQPVAGQPAYGRVAAAAVRPAPPAAAVAVAAAAAWARPPPPAAATAPLAWAAAACRPCRCSPPEVWLQRRLAPGRRRVAAAAAAGDDDSAAEDGGGGGGLAAQAAALPGPRARLQQALTAKERAARRAEAEQLVNERKMVMVQVGGGGRGSGGLGFPCWRGPAARRQAAGPCALRTATAAAAHTPPTPPPRSAPRA